MSADFAGLAPARSGSMVPDIVVGVGARAAAAPAEVLALLDACLGAEGLGRRHVAALATLDRKSGHPALLEAAARLGVPLLSLPPAVLSPLVPSPSRRVEQLAGLPSVAEAAAMACGTLLAGKRRSANVTCALARRGANHALPGSSSASIAASTLSTSCAGP